MTTRYEAVHQNLKGPGDARPTALQIIKDENLEGKWADKTVLITGCSSGIGIETAKALHETGATIYATARDLSKAKTALSSILDSGRVHLLELDLNSLASVRKAAQTFLAQSKKLNVLILNAGIMACPEGRTADGHETQFGTNHLAHFLLIQHLLPTLEQSATPSSPSRVVHEGIYHPWAVYGQSKTANIYTASELERRYGSKNVHAYSVHPGLIVTGLMQHLDQSTIDGWNAVPEISRAMKNPEQGAATTVWAATAKALEGSGGKYLEECQISRPVGKEKFEEYEFGYAPHAFDEEKEKLLWEKSLELVKPFLA
ncbi:Putative short-chain dehydrogenase/reductase SDR, NAD(P)-binding domain superfamily [Septoria linicola]|uniref:Short-chain dehydrogenase/reductase SDR, NAD(P)-binding domain superfamily n=1 Tax=Septoria linicola TaxID=215465 RepID=A0A9Q9ANV1_9PEZI|nr:Putative short-chain dehydrogenase/reductase SDR, NAD(P)-binding domain superfamily [Septoria linicola]